jgi:hypothetical protein
MQLFRAMYEFYSLLYIFGIFSSFERFQTVYTIYTTCFNIKKHHILPADTSANKQQLFIPTALTVWYFNGEAVCLLRGKTELLYNICVNFMF